MKYFDQYFWQLREIQRILGEIRPELSAVESISKSAREHMDQLAELRQAFALPPDYLTERERIREIIENTLASRAAALALSEHRTISGIARSQYELDVRIRELTETAQAHVSTKRVLQGLATAEALRETGRLREELVASALRPQIAYQDFVREHLEAVATAASDELRANRVTLVTAAAELLEDMNSGFELGVLMSSTSPGRYSAPLPAVNIFSELTVEFEEVNLKELDAEESQAEVEAAVQEGKPGRVTRVGARLVRLVYELNTEAEREGKAPVFKPTTKTLHSCSIIPTRVASDGDSFAEVVDHLYFLLYEGSGHANRLTERLSADRLEALWRLRDLRTSARHDVDHGSAKDVRKKQHRLGDAYRSLIGNVSPRVRAEWIQAQIALYSQLVEMLETIWFEGQSGNETS